MAQTYDQIQRQIEKLQRQAESLRAIEIKGVIERVKVAVAHYGLTAEQLGLGKASKAAQSTRSKSKAVAKSTPKFSDDQGHEWVGRGPRPQWLRKALEAGHAIDEFKAGAQRKGSMAPAMESASTPVAASVPKARKAPPRIRYADDAGNAWSGMGPKPRWLKAALDAGKTLEELAK